MIAPLRHHAALLLAAASQEKQKQLATETFFWLSIIVVLAVVLGVVALILKRRLGAVDDDAPPLGFSLRDLRELHARGELTDEELQAAEQRALARERARYLGDEADEPGADVTDVGDITDPTPRDAAAGSTGDPPPESPDDEGPEKGPAPGGTENPR